MINKKCIFNFNIDKSYDGFNYYRSLTPIDKNNMPAPHTTGIMETQFIDRTMVPGKRYYVIFGAIKGEAIRLSDQIIAYSYYDEYIDNVVYYAPYMVDFLNEITNTTSNLEKFNNVFINEVEGAINPGCVSLLGNSYITAGINLNIGNTPFCIDFYVKAPASSGANGLISVDGVRARDYSAITLVCSNGLYVSSNGTSWNIASGISMAGMCNNNWNHVAISWDKSVLRGFVNGNQKSSANFTGTFAQQGTTTFIGTKSNEFISQDILIQHFRVTKGVARYTANFVPPTRY